MPSAKTLLIILGMVCFLVAVLDFYPTRAIALGMFLFGLSLLV